MKKYLKAVLTISAALVFVTGVAFAEPSVVPPDKPYAGMTYGDWSAAWWQWHIQTPNGGALYGDDDSWNGQYDCVSGQKLVPVFFLVGGGSSTTTAIRTCTIPQGKAIFFPIINAECSTVEADPFYGGTEYDLRSCVSSWGNATNLKTLRVTVDGAPLQHLQNARAQSPVFTFHSVATGILGVDGTGSSASDGYWVLLNPLPPGKHTIHFEAAAPEVNNYQSVTYKLTVE
ncbi:hypothetical protein LPW11_06790 [Geomonas sp. RF6]|uniref:hypothetical protein n=1 Tax=Geomonas sp. RF6 TaxID=2897342 RepID=UPI001E333F6E|nr:hypothetical protein [Geomonas sp. RF6]UFS71894.1 hypothetical protein LPW11_06790 [Geomonas sp. RF6]